MNVDKTANRAPTAAGFVQMTPAHPNVGYCVYEDGLVMIATERGLYRLEADRLVEVGFLPHA